MDIRHELLRLLQATHIEIGDSAPQTPQTLRARGHLTQAIRLLSGLTESIEPIGREAPPLSSQETQRALGAESPIPVRSTAEGEALYRTRKDK